MTQVSAALADRLWAALWQGVLVMGIVWVICKFVKGLSPRLRYWLWWLACLKLLLVLAPTASISVPKQAAAMVPEKIVNAAQALAPETLASPAANLQATGNLGSAAFPWFVVLGALWALGVFAGLVLLSAEWLRLGALLKRSQKLSNEPLAAQVRVLSLQMGLSRPPKVCRSDEVTSPFVAGMFRTWLVVPADVEANLTPEELRMALAHELAHLRRHDLLLGLCPSLARLLFFFLPPVYVAQREWATERESVCDEDAIAFTGGKAADYGQLLMKIVSHDHAPALSPCVGATGSFYTLKRRIAAMKTYGVRSPRFLKVGAPAMLFAVAALLLPWQCSKSAAAGSTAGGGLVANSGFEQGMAGWEAGAIPPGAPPNVKVSIVDSGHSGKAILFEKTEQRFFPISLYQQTLQPPPAGAKKVHVSAWIKADNAAKATIPIFFDSGSTAGTIEWGAYVGQKSDSDPLATFDWKQYTNTLEIPAGTTGVRVGLEMYGPGKVWIDDVQVTYQ
jgi:beta-lactamase regulating signal transducer with metallopeptidase domain